MKIRRIKKQGNSVGVGQVVDIPDNLAKSIVAKGYFEFVEEPAPKKPAAKKPSKKK